MPSFKFGVKVMPREVILDTQGRAVEQVLKNMDLAVDRCRVGRYVEIEVPAANQQVAEEKVRQMAKTVLSHPLIEDFYIQSL